MPFHIGLDLGEIEDQSALAVIHEVVDPIREQEGYKRRLLLRYLYPFERRTPYEVVVGQVAQLLGNAELRPEIVQVRSASGSPLVVKRDRPPALVMDDSGVGRGVYRLFKVHGIKPVGVTITGSSGSAPKRDKHEGSRWRVPKVQLVFDLIQAIDTKRLEVPAGLEHWDTLREQLLRFSRKQNERTGHIRFEHERATDKDDLVMALSLALWSVKRPRSPLRVVR
jgi:hypothetical protein